MSSVGVKMEIEDGASATVTEIIQAMIDDESVDLPSSTGSGNSSSSNSGGATGGSSGGTSSAPPRLTSEVLTLWMTSPLLDVQLKPHHKPFYIRREWNHFLQRFSSAPLEKKSLDEPILSLQRNVFFHKRDEVKIRSVNQILIG